MRLDGGSDIYCLSCQLTEIRFGKYGALNLNFEFEITNSRGISWLRQHPRTFQLSSKHSSLVIKVDGKLRYHWCVQGARGFVCRTLSELGLHNSALLPLFSKSMKAAS
jgi:hypothetical protein